MANAPSPRFMRYTNTAMRVAPRQSPRPVRRLRIVKTIESRNGVSSTSSSSGRSVACRVIGRSTSTGVSGTPHALTTDRCVSRPRDAPICTVTVSAGFHGEGPRHARAVSHNAGTGRRSGTGAYAAVSMPNAVNQPFQSGRPPFRARYVGTVCSPMLH